MHQNQFYISIDYCFEGSKTKVKIESQGIFKSKMYADSISYKKSVQRRKTVDFGNCSVKEERFSGTVISVKNKDHRPGSESGKDGFAES